MTYPSEPQYPQYQTPPGGPGYPPAPPPPRGPGLSARLGERALRRPEPRLGVSLAGAGIALAVLGVLVWGGDYLTSAGGGGGGGDGSARRLLGVALSLAVVVAGYALAIRRRSGPLASAGVVASALGVPVLVAFLSFHTAHGGQSGPPFSLDAIVAVSVLAWLVSYLVVPGTRGHALYVGLAAVATWIYLLNKAEPSLFGAAFVRIFFLFAPAGLFDVGSAPDWTTVALLCLVFGLGYYAATFVLDHVGRPGPGAALAVAGFLATASGIAAAAVNLPTVGTGVLLIVVGLILAGFGARGVRRFTTWGWSAGVALGVTVIIAKLSGQNSAAAGVALILSGAVVVLIGQLLTGALHEPDDLAPTISGVAATREAWIQ